MTPFSFSTWTFIYYFILINKITPAVSPGGLRWCFFFFGRDGWLISLRFVFGAWGGSLGASVRANVRVRLACSGRFYLECTQGPVVYMGRSSVQFRHKLKPSSAHGT